MLEFNKYLTKEIKNLKDFITVVYVIVDDIYQESIPAHIKDRKNVKYSILSDSEIITISIVGELMTIDSEKAWFNFCKKNLRDLFPRFCDRTRFNRTRRNLQTVIGGLTKQISSKLGYYQEPYRIADSIPIPVCKFGRAVFHKTFKDLASYGRSPFKKETYFGFKLHVLSSFDGYITDIELTSANIDDRQAIWELVYLYNNITIIGDKGYISKELHEQLNKEKNIALITRQKRNSNYHFPREFTQLIFKIRKRIETSFSQLTEQLNLNNVKAKSLLGLITRLKTKILSHNICYFINKCLNKNVDIGKIKELIFG